MKASFLLQATACAAVLLFASCGPGEGTNGRTGDFDRNNKLEDHDDDDRKDRREDRNEMSDTNASNYDNAH